jgi:LacI family transcriptional regulator
VPINGNQRPTQRQIAAQVGVSVATVSRILNAQETKPERWASPKTVAAIQAAAAELGYRRNALAVGLRTQRSHTIGVLLAGLGDDPTARIVAGIDEVAREHNLTTLVTTTDDNPTLRTERTFSMLDRSVDGLIFADAHLEESFLDQLQALNIPFTLVQRRHRHHVGVTADDLMAGTLAADHLINSGRQQLAVITAPRYMSTGYERTKAYVERVAQAGLAEPRVLETGVDVEAGRQAALILLDGQGWTPNGVFATDDSAALGAIGVFRQRGWRVPEDIAVIGCHDTPTAAATGLSSLSTDLKAMGRRAMELLLDRFAGLEIESERLPVSLRVRHSTDPNQPIGTTRAE